MTANPQSTSRQAAIEDVLGCFNQCCTEFCVGKCTCDNDAIETLIALGVTRAEIDEVLS